jgi:hypothetical protein
LSSAFGYWHKVVDKRVKPLVAILLLKIARYFSYSDEKVAKLYKSKFAKKRLIIFFSEPLIAFLISLKPYYFFKFLSSFSILQYSIFLLFLFMFSSCLIVRSKILEITPNYSE